MRKEPKREPGSGESAVLEEKAKALCDELKNDGTGSADLMARVADMISNCELRLRTQEDLVKALASHPNPEFRNAVLEETKLQFSKKLPGELAGRYIHLLERTYAHFVQNNSPSTSK